MPGKRKITPEAVQAIRAAIDRGAFTADRAADWAEQIVAADDPSEIVGWINDLAGRDGRAPAVEDEGQLEADRILLYPPRTAEEAEEQHRIAASVAGSRAVEDEDFSHLFPPATPEEAEEQHRITASRPRPQRAVEDDPDEEWLHAAVFGDAEYTGHGGLPHAPYGGGRR